MQNIKQYLEEYRTLKDDLEYYEHKMEGVKSPTISNEAKSTIVNPKYSRELEKRR